MKKIYLIIGSRGEYDSHYEWNVEAFFNENDAKQKVIELNKRTKLFEEANIERVRLCDSWRKNNPRPEIGSVNNEEFIKWIKSCNDEENRVIAEELCLSKDEQEAFSNYMFHQNESFHIDEIGIS